MHYSCIHVVILAEELHVVTVGVTDKKFAAGVLVHEEPAVQE